MFYVPSSFLGRDVVAPRGTDSTMSKESAPSSVKVASQVRSREDVFGLAGDLFFVDAQLLRDDIGHLYKAFGRLSRTPCPWYRQWLLPAGRRARSGARAGRRTRRSRPARRRGPGGQRRSSPFAPHRNTTSQGKLRDIWSLVSLVSLVSWVSWLFRSLLRLFRP